METVIATLTRMGIVSGYGNAPWTPLQIRLIVAGLFDHGRLDMRPDGILMLPEETPDPAIEYYLGSWYVTTVTGHVKGPFTSGLEAENVASLCSKGLQSVGS